MGATSRLLAPIVVVTLLVGSSYASLITNGSFESGPSDTPLVVVFAPNSTTIPGWTVTGGSVEYITTFWVAADGTRSLDLNGWSLGTITQTFPTVVGQPYLVRFALAGNPDAQPRTTTVRVWVDDPNGRYRDFSFEVNGQSRQEMGWVYHAWTFVALSASTTLGFTSRDYYYHPVYGNAMGPALDDVSVVEAPAVPEPASLILAGLGLTAIALLRRR